MFVYIVTSLFVLVFQHVLFTSNFDRNMEELRVLELFSGIGGMHHALQSESRHDCNQFNFNLTYFRELCAWKNSCGNRHQ